ncbi:phage tail protein [Martelella alba]|uniref:Phage tail protein n=1 Tax=Martelella alba TaxID=2590451 RepID=A0ABY2SEH4_9HYPH|nr:phage tail protein [Martelella alba]TKI02760.1 phage tail protein [Martelella alba]
MIHTFKFSPRVSPTGDLTPTVRETQLGDGYTQRSGDGINSEAQSWALTFVGNWDYVSPIVQFLRDHKGYIAFQWRNPLFEMGLYCCKQYQVTPLGNNNFSLTATFITAYHP